MVGVRVNGKDIRTRSVVSNANLKTTVLKLVGEAHWIATSWKKRGPCG